MVRVQGNPCQSSRTSSSGNPSRTRSGTRSSTDGFRLARGCSRPSWRSGSGCRAGRSGTRSRSWPGRASSRISRGAARSSASLSEKDLEEVYVLRRAIEEAAVRLAIARAADAEIAEMYARLAETEDAYERADLPAAWEADMAFHRTYCRMSGNGRLADLFEGLASQTVLLMRTALASHASLALDAACRAAPPDRRRDQGTGRRCGGARRGRALPVHAGPARRRLTRWPETPDRGLPPGAGHLIPGCHQRGLPPARAAPGPATPPGHTPVRRRFAGPAPRRADPMSATRAHGAATSLVEHPMRRSCAGGPPGRTP